MSIYNTGIPTMPFYQVTKREFREMMTPEDQIMWIYAHLGESASAEYVDEENAKQDASFEAYKIQMLVTLAALKKDILDDVDVIAKIGNLWACQLGQDVNSKLAMRLVHKDACALHGANVEELAEGMSRIATVQVLATSGLNVFGMASYAKTYSQTGSIAPGAGTTNDYPF